MMAAAAAAAGGIVVQQRTLSAEVVEPAANAQPKSTHLLSFPSTLSPSPIYHSTTPFTSAIHLATLCDTCGPYVRSPSTLYRRITSRQVSKRLGLASLNLADCGRRPQRFERSTASTRTSPLYLVTIAAAPPSSHPPSPPPPPPPSSAPPLLVSGMPHAEAECSPLPLEQQSTAASFASKHNQGAVDHSTRPDLSDNNIHSTGTCSPVSQDHPQPGDFRRRQSQQSDLAKRAMTSSRGPQDGKTRGADDVLNEEVVDNLRNHLDSTLLSSDGYASNEDADVPSQPHPSTHQATSTPNGPSDAHRDPRSAPLSAKQPPSMVAAAYAHAHPHERVGASMAMNDTPATTAPSSPHIPPLRQNSGTSTPRVRPTTLDIPGLTKSKVSPDGRIAQRDVGSKLVIVMVGLPARGKSYITKKLARYLNWLQHDTKIFNVGERRRVVAGGPNGLQKTKSQQRRDQTIIETHGPSVVAPLGLMQQQQLATETPISPTDRRASVAQIMLNGDKVEAPGTPRRELSDFKLPPSSAGTDPRGQEDEEEPQNTLLGADLSTHPTKLNDAQAMEQNASFFDPDNKRAALIREQVALETLDELLDYILDGNGSVGILDATNSTLERRKMVMKHIRERAGSELNVLFLESACFDPDLLEANIRLKLNGPDYKDKDPVTALEDFKKRIVEYEKAYVPLGDYEERNNMPYIQMIDVGRKVISHQIRGFLSAQANYYLLNFNLAPRQIWITRHGLSQDNVSGKIGGDSDLAPEGQRYAQSLTRFMDEKRKEWDVKQIEAAKNTHFPPQPGDVTPPNPHYSPNSPSNENPPDSISNALEEVPGYVPKNFCVWTSMLKRSIQTAQYFNDEDYDTKQMRMLDELNAGVMEGLTYSCISTKFPEEYASRKADKLHYRYPGPGGEGYLDIINRLRPVIVELERMTDHVLLVGHRSVARVLLAYFRGLKAEEVADLDVPLGMLYCLEPKPYGVDFKAYKWDRESEWFYEVPNFQLKRAEDDMQ